MGMKSRAHWAVDVCLRRCSNRALRCGDCVGNSHYVQEGVITLKKAKGKKGGKKC